MPATVRISPAAHRSLAEMAKQTNSSLQEVLDRAIENERRHLLLQQTGFSHASGNLREIEGPVRFRGGREKRYWLHMATNRFDGTIVGQQLEEVTEQAESIRLRPAFAGLGGER